MIIIILNRVFVGKTQIFKQQNILVNNSNMLRQKKMLLQRATLNKPLTISLNQNLQLQLHTKEANKPSSQTNTPKNLQNRVCLHQIETNQNNLNQTHQTPYARQKNKYSLNASKDFPLSKTKEHDPIFSKISQLIKNEELRIPAGHSKHLKRVLERPSTSLSQTHRKSLQQSNICQGKLVFHLANVQEQWAAREPRPISTSRALMNYSKVYRNASGERFKVRRDRSIYRNSVHLEAQKVVLQQKYKKEKILISKSTEKAVFAERMVKYQPGKGKKDRYADQQQFQLDGWQYFQ